MLGSLVTWNRVVECQSADRQRIGAGRVAQLVEDSVVQRNQGPGFDP